MKSLRPVHGGLLIAVLLAAQGQSEEVQVDRKNDRQERLVALPRKAPAPKGNPTSSDRVALGKLLFFDPRLSGDNKMSCATCHIPQKAFADGLAAAKGNRGKRLKRNTQSVLNVGFYKRLFWDGRAKSLEAQALLPITSPDEMNQPLSELETELRSVPGYRRQFQEVFGEAVTRRGIAQALAAYQRSLVSAPSPFDRFLAGEKQALSESARRGYELFRGDAGCIRCHHGPLLSDGKFYRLGVSFKDKGLGAISGRKSDDYKFRTPSLRNIAITGPYMHDGSLKTLDDVVTFYYRGVPASAPDGQPLDIEALDGQSFSDIAAVVAFLKSLTGAFPKEEAPKLPK